MELIRNVILAVLLFIPQIAAAVCVQGDCTNGLGTAVLHDGSRYVGEFREGVRSGRGSITYPDGTIYKGQWTNDRPNGHGVKILADGMQYSGNFKNGKMYGSGIMFMPDGSQVKIQWLRDPSPAKEEKPPEAAISTSEVKNDRDMISTLKDSGEPHSQESQKSPGHMKVSLQESAASAERTPNQEPGTTAAVAAEQIPPQAAQQIEVAVEEQAQIETVNEIQIAEAEQVVSEAAMTVKKEDGSVPQKGYALYSEIQNGFRYASIVKGRGANIRSDASLTSEVLRTMPEGHPVAVLEQKADWFLVEDFRERKGWVYASLLTEPGTVIIKVYKGNLRSGPSLTDDLIVQLDHGTVMSVEKTLGDWLQVSNSDDLTGWLNRKVIWP
jgi:SH3-like domain-containing protein